MKLSLLQTLLCCLTSLVVRAVFRKHSRSIFRFVKKLKIWSEMWKAQALLVQALLLLCLLVIYFQLTPLQQVETQKTMMEMGYQAPADNLVIFLVDGLRADAIFGKNCSLMDPALLELMMLKGMLGISRASVPTLTSSGRAAILGGFNAMPTLGGSLDTIYNRTTASNGFVLNLSGNHQSVFRQLEETIKDPTNLRSLRNATKLVIAINLVDLEAVSPLDERYVANFEKVQVTIREIYNLMQRQFADRLTAYLLTSPHGLTNFGSHGGGSKYETETPFILWGDHINSIADNVSSLAIDSENMTLPFYKLNQIQLAPLLSAVIGLPPPIHNLGSLPLGYIMGSKDYVLQALHLNALQLLSQAKAVIRRQESGFFHKWLPREKIMDLSRIAYYQTQMDHLLDKGWREKAMETSALAIRLSLQSLKFNLEYFHIPLQVTTTLAILGWMFFLIMQLNRHSLDAKQQRRGFSTLTTILLCSLGILLGELVFLHRASLLTILCLLVPFGVWCVVLAEMPSNGGLISEPLIHWLWIVLPAAVLVLALNCHCCFSLMYAPCVLFYNRRGWFHITGKFLAWLALVLLLSGFLWSQPALLVLMSPNNRVTLQAVSMLLVLLRPCLLQQQHPIHVWLINSGVLLAGGVGIYLREMGGIVPIYIQVANWLYLIYAFIPVLYKWSSSPRSCWQLICFNMLTVHALLSDPFSSLFGQGLIVEYQMSSEMHGENKLRDQEDVGSKDEKLPTPSKHLHMSYQFAVTILLYFYVSLSGTGHWTEGFTYSANTAWLFLPDQFSWPGPLLVLLHLLIPSFIILSRLQALSSFPRQEWRSIFAGLLLICNAAVLFHVVFVNHHIDWPLVHPSVINVLHLLLGGIFLLASNSLVNVYFREFKLS
ncbi:hypothetical protein KR009_001695, partial [Drosophila setifemur]